MACHSSLGAGEARASSRSKTRSVIRHPNKHPQDRRTGSGMRGCSRPNSRSHCSMRVEFDSAMMMMHSRDLSSSRDLRVLATREGEWRHRADEAEEGPYVDQRARRCEGLAWLARRRRRMSCKRLQHHVRPPAAGLGEDSVQLMKNRGGGGGGSGRRDGLLSVLLTRTSTPQLSQLSPQRSKRSRTMAECAFGVRSSPPRSHPAHSSRWRPLPVRQSWEQSARTS